MKRAVLFQIHKGGIRRLQHSNAAETAKKSQFSLQKSSELGAPLESNPRTSEGHPRTGAAAGWALHQKCLPRVTPQVWNILRCREGEAEEDEGDRLEFICTNPFEFSIGLKEVLYLCFWSDQSASDLLQEKKRQKNPASSVWLTT